MSVNQTLAMKESDGLQRGRENVARFRGGERALRKKLREIFLGEFHYDIKQIEISETAAAGFEDAKHVRMRELGGVLPAKQLEFRVGLVDLNELDGRLLWRSAAFGQEDGAVFRAAEIAAKREFGIDNLAFPLLPGFGHRCTPAPG